MVSLVENQTVQGELLTHKEQLRQQVELTVNRTPAIDVHTHVHPPAFNGLFLSGIDDLLTYHYLIAETLRSSDLSHADFWRMTKAQRADFVWKTLFVESTPLSEAARGIVSILAAFNLDTRAPNLDDVPEFFRLGFEGAVQFFQSRNQMILQFLRGADVNRRGNHVVARLPHVDVIVGMNRVVRSDRLP